MCQQAYTLTLDGEQTLYLHVSIIIVSMLVCSAKRGCLYCQQDGSGYRPSSWHGPLCTVWQTAKYNNTVYWTRRLSNYPVMALSLIIIIIIKDFHKYILGHAYRRLQPGVVTRIPNGARDVHLQTKKFQTGSLNLWTITILWCWADESLKMLACNLSLTAFGCCFLGNSTQADTTKCRPCMNLQLRTDSFTGTT